MVTKFVDNNGVHKEQEKIDNFYGNSLFASDNTIMLKSTSRKDDIESLIYILCFLYTGILPVIEFINSNIDHFKMSDFINEVLVYRKNNMVSCS